MSAALRSSLLASYSLRSWAGGLPSLTLGWLHGTQRTGMEPQVHVADAGVAVAARPLHWLGELEPAEPGEQLVEQHLHLEPRESRTEAEVRTVSEREVRVRIAGDVELHRAFEDRLV